jgi:hypothetical protein
MMLRLAMDEEKEREKNLSDPRLGEFYKGLYALRDNLDSCERRLGIRPAPELTMIQGDAAA